MSATYARFDKEESEPPGRLLPVTPSHTPVRRLRRLLNQYAMTEQETFFARLYAGLIGGGVGLGWWGEALWFGVGEVTEGGLCLGMAGTAAVAAFSVTLIFSTVSAGIVAWTLYKDLMAEAESLHAAMLEEIQKHEDLQDILFFEMLRLRCFFDAQDDAAFEEQANSILKDHLEDLDKPRLIQLVNQTYCRLKNKNFYEDEQGNLVETDEHAERFSFTHVLTDPRLSNHLPNREYIMECARENIPNFNRSLDDAIYRDIDLPVRNRWKAGLWGISGAVGMGGSILGAGWMIPSYLIGAALLAAIPIGGWIALIAVSVVLAVAFGYGVGVIKQKHIQCEAHIAALKQQNAACHVLNKTFVAENFSRTRQLEKSQKQETRMSTSVVHSLLNTDTGLQAKGSVTEPVVGSVPPVVSHDFKLHKTLRKRAASDSCHASVRLSQLKAR